MRVIPHESSNLAHLDQDQDQGEGLQIKLYLSYSYFFYEMADRHVDIDVLRNRKDEYDIDFEYAAFALERYVVVRSLIWNAGTQAHSQSKDTRTFFWHLTRIFFPNVTAMRFENSGTGKHSRPRYSANGLILV
jgi:hypothetical protein